MEIYYSFIAYCDHDLWVFWYEWCSPIEIVVQDDLPIYLDTHPTPTPPDNILVTAVPPDIAEKLWFDPDSIHGLESATCLYKRQVAYWTKYIDAGGYAIVGTDYVENRIFYAIREYVLKATSKRPELLEQMTPENNFAMHLLRVGTLENNTPRFRVNYPRPMCFDGGQCQVIVELDKRDGILSGTSMHILVHEFAHAINFAIDDIDAIDGSNPRFGARLKAAYNHARENGSWFGENTPAFKNQFEYWAAGVRWMHLKLTNPVFNLTFPAGTNIEYKGYLDTFKETDALLYELIDEWLPIEYLGDINQNW